MKIAFGLALIVVIGVLIKLRAKSNKRIEKGFMETQGRIPHEKGLGSVAEDEAHLNLMKKLAEEKAKKEEQEAAMKLVEELRKERARLVPELYAREECARRCEEKMKSAIEKIACEENISYDKVLEYGEKVRAKEATSDRDGGSGGMCFFVFGMVFGFVNMLICWVIQMGMAESAMSLEDVKWAILVPMAAGEFMLLLQVYLGSHEKKGLGFWLAFGGFCVAAAIMGTILSLLGCKEIEWSIAT